MPDTQCAGARVPSLALRRVNFHPDCPDLRLAPAPNTLPAAPADGPLVILSMTIVSTEVFLPVRPSWPHTSCTGHKE